MIGSVISDPQQQLNLLNDFYASVLTRTDEAAPTKEKVTAKVLDDIEITLGSIEQIIDGLKEQSAAGPDGVPNRIIIDCKEELSKPLQILFRRSMDGEVIPEEWRLANITPIFKKRK